MVFIPDEEYSKILKLIPICCVDIAVVRSDQKLLLIKRKQSETYGGLWWIVGGRIYRGETWEEAVKRKALVETGLNVSITKKVQSYEVAKDSASHHFITTMFVTSIIGSDQVQLDETSDDYKWSDTIDDNWHPLLVEMIRDSEIFDG